MTMIVSVCSLKYTTNVCDDDVIVAKKKKKIYMYIHNIHNLNPIITPHASS